MKKKPLQRVMSSALAGALMISAAPLSAFAASELSVDAPVLVKNAAGKLTLKADKNVNGTQKVTVKNYMPETNMFQTDLF